MRFISHFAWHLITLVTIAIFIAAGFLGLLGTAFLYISPLFEAMFSPEGLEVVFKNDPEIRNIVNTCINKDGNLINVVSTNNMADTLNSLNEYIFKLDEIKIRIENLKESYAVNQASNLYNDINNNIVLDPASENDSPATVVDNLNRYTDSNYPNTYQASCSNEVYDNWADSSNYCKASYSIVDESNVSNNLGSNSCLIIRQWNDNNVKLRYSERPNNCNNFEFANLVSSYISRLKLYISEASDIIKIIQSDLDE